MPKVCLDGARVLTIMREVMKNDTNLLRVVKRILREKQERKDKDAA